MVDPLFCESVENHGGRWSGASLGRRETCACAGVEVGRMADHSPGLRLGHPFHCPALLQPLKMNFLNSDDY